MRTRRLAATVFVVTLLLLGSLPAGLAAADVKINTDAPGTVQNEVRMTRNATDLNNFVVAYNDAIGALSSPLGISHSGDGGATWNDTQLSIPAHPLIGGPDDGLALPFIFDPYIDSDPSGNVFAGYVAAMGGPGGPSGLYLERSQDKGKTWSGPTTISFDTRALSPTDPNYRFNDRPDMTVDAGGNVLVVSIKDVGQSGPTGDIYFARSPAAVVPVPGNPTGLDFTGVSPGSVASKTINDNPNGTDWANVPDVVVAADGTIYVSWINLNVTKLGAKPATLMLDRSTDSGGTFGADTAVRPIRALPNWLSTTSGAGTFDDARSGSYPVIGVDPANSQTVYLAYAATGVGSDEADIFFILSTDGGTTWSAPITVNDDTTAHDQFHPVMAVDPAGTIALAWYDKRNSANDNAWDVYLATSIDGGLTFSSNLRITDTTFVTPTDLFTQPWMGEYFGLVVDPSHAFLAFTSSAQDGFGDIFFDAVPSPVLRCRNQIATMVGTPGADTLTGTAGNDVIAGWGGDDTIDGRGGNDFICGGAGDDLLIGGTGNDRLFGGPGQDTLRGNGGRDRLVGQGLADVLVGGPGNDTLRGERGNDRLFGNKGDDYLAGNPGGDRLDGGPGTDVLNGGPGIDNCINGETMLSC